MMTFVANNADAEMNRSRKKMIQRGSIFILSDIFKKYGSYFLKRR